MARKKSLNLKQVGGLLAGAGLGAGLMYLLDPQGGARRRSQAGGKLKSLASDGQQKLKATSRDLSQRTKGMAIEGFKKVRSEEVPDSTLVQRIRSEMGHRVSDAGNIEVLALGGSVTLRGRVQENEKDQLLSAIKSVPGVKSVDDRLEAFSAETASTETGGNGQTVRPN